MYTKYNVIVELLYWTQLKKYTYYILYTPDSTYYANISSAM